MPMPSHRLTSLVLCIGSLVLASAASHARADIDLRIGLKGVFTLSGQSNAEAPPTQTAAFYDSSLGAGGGGGLYGELHLSKLFGIELDLLFESNRSFFDGSVADIDFTQHVSFEQLRVPLLAKLFLQLGDSFELNAGLGPELILGLGSSPSTELTNNRTTLSDANVRQSFDYFYRSDEDNGVAIAVELGCSFYTLRYQIPIALRFAYNVLGKAAYADRVVVDGTQRTSTFAAVETFQLGLVVGFGFLIPPRDPPPPPKKQLPQADDPFAPFSGRR